MKPNKKDVTISYKGKKIVVTSSYVHPKVYLDCDAYYLARETRCIN